jgi:aspartate/methionine/tyrosine aminotransferase
MAPSGAKLPRRLMMHPRGPLRAAEIESRLARAKADFADLCKARLKIDMTRGKPSAAQLDFSNALLTLPGNGDFYQSDGGDTRNYFGSMQGLPEARILFSQMLGAPPERILIGNNSSLALMHDCIVYALLKGVPGGTAPWSAAQPITFLCPTPGYDRHFAICEEYGIRMVSVPLTGSGPDMNVVEELALDPAVRGMWCVPKYSNPTGEIYADEVVQRIAVMRTGAPDFRVFWDNAYSVHHLSEQSHEIANILELSSQAGHPNRPLVFASTSKMTFGGGGLGLLAASEANIAWFVARCSKRTIGPDKLNQLRHVRFLRDHGGIERLMAQHRRLLQPKFEAVDAALERRLHGSGFASWTRPEGGYFVSVEVHEGCAARVVELAKAAGILMVPAGQTFPYRKDPYDSNLRIAPSFPDLKDVAAAAEAIAISIDYAVAERLSTQHRET